MWSLFIVVILWRRYQTYSSIVTKSVGLVWSQFIVLRTEVPKLRYTWAVVLLLLLIGNSALVLIAAQWCSVIAL